MGTVALCGYGRFGRALGSLLEEAGRPYRALDPSPAAAVPEPQRAASLPELVEGAEIVVLAMPVPAMRAALFALRPHLRPEQLVLDVGSVKVRPAAALAEVLGAEIPWAATHPLFGPISLARAERPLRVVLCPSALHPGAAARARAFYEGIGCEVIEQSAEGHDHVMAYTHALTFFVAKGMLDAGAGEAVPFAPPSFQAIARTIEAVRADAGHLFRAIQGENPFAAEARRHLLGALTSVDRALLADPGEGPDEAPGEAPGGGAAQAAGDAAAAVDAAGDAAGAAPGAASPRDRDPLTIPDLGARSPELREAREHIDAIDREIVALLGRRAEIARRAARAKAALGRPVLDPAREAALIAERRAWAEEASVDPDCVDEIYRAILRLSRRAQTRSDPG